jgi:hypothetical protein
MFLCENSFHARFIRLFILLFRCMELALIIVMGVNDLHARFIRLFYYKLIILLYVDYFITMESVSLISSAEAPIMMSNSPGSTT